MVSASVRRLVGCNDPKPNPKPIVPSLGFVAYYYSNGCWAYSILTIEECQYVSIGHGLAHKGNCTNAIHIYNKPNAEKQ